MAEASPQEVLVGEVVSFSSADSLDPDDGPQPLTFSWDFGDGTQSTEADPTHSYDALGLYVVSLQVDDGAASSLVTLDVVVLQPPTPTPPTCSGPIALTPDDATLAVVNPDSDSISFVDVGNGTVDEIDVGDHPRAVALSDDGSTAYVAIQDEDAIAVLDVASRTVTDTWPVGHGPWAVAAVPGDGRLVVSHEREATVRLVDPAAPEAAVILDVPDTPRAVAVTADGTRAYVTHFLTRGDVGQVSVIDLTTDTVLAQTELVEDLGPDTASSGKGFPNLLGAAAVHPAGHSIWVGGLKANTNRGTYLNGEPLVPRKRLRGLMAMIDPTTDAEVVMRRIDTNDADSVTGIAFSPLGRYAYVLHQGAGRMSVYDLPVAALVSQGDGDTAPFDARPDTGHAPQGVVVSSDGTRVYVANFMSRDVVVFDTSSFDDPVLLETIAVTEEPLGPNVANGKRMFYRSREPVHSDQNYIACASCHPDGGHDGRTWDFTQVGEGLRNTIDLRGHGGTDHGPVHWSANFDEIQDFENDIVNGFGGEGLAAADGPPHPPLSPEPNAGRSQDLDDLAAYVATLTTPPPSPYREADGSLSEAAVRGMDIFLDPDVGCADCHVPPRFTDSTLTPDPADFILHDVGTLTEASGQRLGMELTGLDTPTLLGVWATPPYLHDGRAATVLEVLTTENPDDAHGVTSTLSADELDDLVAYVLSLDGSPDEAPEPPGGDTGTGTGTGGVTGGTSTGAGPGTDGDLDSTGGDGSASGEGGGCGCATAAGGGGLWWLAMGGLFALGRHRRRKTRP